MAGRMKRTIVRYSKTPTRALCLVRRLTPPLPRITVWKSL
jgi:hypothetical protein